jgi:hypothetical protein
MITAVSDPKRDITNIQRTSDGTTLWEIPGWHRGLFVADDGRYAVTSYNGLNLIPVDYSTSLVLFTFWCQGRKVRDVTIGEFIPRGDILVRTVSHYHWGSILGIGKDGRLAVRRADEKVFHYDLTTGKQSE